MFFIRHTLIFEFHDSALIIFFFSCLFPHFLTIMLHKGAKLSCISGNYMSGYVVNLTSLSFLSLFKVVVLSMLCSSLYGQGPAGAPCAWGTSVTHCSTPPPSCHLAQCLHLLPCLFSTPSSVPLWHPVCLPDSCVQVWGSLSRREAAALQSCYKSMCLLRGPHTHMCPMDTYFL